MRTVIEDRWLSVDEIAAYLGIKRDTVYKWIDQKRMPAHRVGRLWKFKKEEVDRWVHVQPKRHEGTAHTPKGPKGSSKISTQQEKKDARG
jgi:excisionase family DNA binding protein